MVFVTQIFYLKYNNIAILATKLCAKMKIFSQNSAKTCKNIHIIITPGKIKQIEC